ncbi:MAG: autotransporter outer membrane beta-barrel domain-containing protein [Sutterellaceae bacterium]|nr:autotransporter outer membrane beta-barrel domain-containing protein [Sutterellaceae bacterium]
MTIGEASATDKTIDSIASGVSGATIEKTGAGKLVINSSTQAFAGGFTVSEGAVEMATGIGEYSIKVASGKEGALDSTFTVKDKASATIQAVNAVAGQGKVTYKAEQGSSLAFNEFNVASGAQSVIEANSAVAIGSLNVKGATPVEEATPTAEENATPLAAGKLTVSGALNLETLNNAGEIVSGAAADLTIGSGSNSGSVFWGSQKQDKVTVAGEFTNSGLMQAKTFVVNGTLNTGMFVTAGDNLSNHVKFDQLDLNAGAKFVITKLPEDQDGTAMAFTDGTINLNGGQFYVGDANTVFTGNVTTDKQANIYINAGSYKYANLTVNGQAEISEGSLTVTGLLGGTGSVVVSDLGTMVLDVTKNFDLTDDGSYAAKDGFNNVEVQDGATLTLAGLTEVTKAQVGQLQKAMSQGSTGILNLGETKISDIEVTDGVVAYNDVSSLGSITTAQLAQTTVSGVTEGGALAGEFAKAVLADQATGLSVGKNQVLVLNGANDMLVKTAEGKAGNVQLAADSIFRTTGANAVIGDVTAAESSNGGLLYVVSGNLTADNVKVNELWVDVGTAFDAKKADIAGGDVYGNVSVQELIVGQGGLNIGSSEENATGHISVETFTSGVMFVDPAWLNDQTLTLNAASTAAIGTLAKAATVEAGQGSVVALGTTDASEATAALSALGINKLGDASAEGNEGLYKAVVYVNGGKTAENAAQTIAGKVYASGHSEADHKASQDTISGVQIGANTLLLINAATVDVEGKTAVFGQNVTLDQGSQTLIANAANGDKVLLSSSVTNNGAIGLTDGDRILGVKLDEGIASVALKNQLGELDHLATIDSIKGLYTDRSLANSKSVQFNKWLMSSDNGLANDAAVVQAGNDVAAIGATAGMASVTLDAMSAFNDTVATRTNILAARGEGVNVWADVNGGRYSAKKLMDGAGYASDIYAGVLGVDAQFAGTVVGAALTVGTGDTDSKNTSAETSMDSDFFGLSVYASHKFGDIFNVAADFGYMQGSNDVSANYNLGSFSADTDAFTLGIRGELLAEVAGFNLVPHVGLRWTQISTDSFEAGYMTDIDDINVFQMPVGITVSGDVKVGGWTASPMFDLSFVPTFGDKNAEMKLGIAGVKASDDLAVRVVDSNPVQATLGVNAVNGAWSFGLDYKLGVGSDDRMNNTFNARLNYAF